CNSEKYYHFICTVFYLNTPISFIFSLFPYTTLFRSRIDSSRKIFNPLTTSGGVLNTISATDKGITSSDTLGFNGYICSHFNDPVFFLLPLVVIQYAIFYCIFSMEDSLVHSVIQLN